VRQPPDHGCSVRPLRRSEPNAARCIRGSAEFGTGVGGQQRDKMIRAILGFMRGSGRPAPWAKAALVLWFLLGVLLGAYHHHPYGQSEDGCALCVFVHTAAFPATPVVVANAPQTLPQTVELAEASYTPVSARTTASPRAPPLG